MFDESVFNRIAAALSDLDKSVRELTVAMKCQASAGNGIMGDFGLELDTDAIDKAKYMSENYPPIDYVVTPMMEPTRPVDKQYGHIDTNGWPFPVSKNIPHRG